MPGSNQTGVQTQTQKAEPWGPQQDYLKGIFGQAQNIYQQPGPDYYPGQTYAPMAPETEQALSMTDARAQQGSPLVSAAKSNVLDTLNGNATNPYLSGLQGQASGQNINPYLDQMYQAASRPMIDQFQKATVPGIAGQFLSGGRYGSGAMKDQIGMASDVLGQNLAGLSANVYGSGWENAANRQASAQSQLAGLGENFLGRQQSAAQYAPALAANDYADIAQLAGAGQTRQDYAMQQIQDQINRYNFGQQQPANKLAQFLQFVQGDYGGTKTTSQPVYSNRASSTLGGALTGGMLGNMMNNPFLGTMLGGGLGLLGG